MWSALLRNAHYTIFLLIFLLIQIGASHTKLPCNGGVEWCSLLNAFREHEALPEFSLLSIQTIFRTYNLKIWFKIKLLQWDYKVIYNFKYYHLRWWKVNLGRLKSRRLQAELRRFEKTYWFWIYLRIISSLTLPTVSAKYPSAQKLSPHKNSSNSGNSCRTTRLLPPFNNWIALLTLIVGFNCINKCTWSSCTFNSSICQSFISAHYLNKNSRRLFNAPFNILFRYFGIHTKWYISLYFDWLPVLNISFSMTVFQTPATLQ